MKVFIVIICIILSCIIASVICVDDKPFTGYIVHKEYTQGHMCCSKAKVYNSYVHVTPVVHRHSWNPSTFKLWVANKNETRIINVDSLLWKSKTSGSKVTF